MGPLAQLAELAHAADTDWALGTHARGAAMLAEEATAERLYREAIERLSRIHTGGSQTLARAHLLYGEWLRRQHRRVDAREQLRIAHAILADMGAEAFAERARRELLAANAPRPRPRAQQWRDRPAKRKLSSQVEEQRPGRTPPARPTQAALAA
jgi:hypothetical protein